MTEFVFGPYRLEVDVEATRAWYDRYGDATGGCDCAYCRNYAAAVETLPPEVAAFLRPLELDLHKPGDATEYGPAEGGRWYMPLWHIAGRLMEAGGGGTAHRPRRHRRVRHGYGAIPPGLPRALLPMLAFHDPPLGAGGTGR